MAMEVLKIHDANFASRPQSLVGKYASYDNSDIIFSKLGDHWRQLCMICANEFFTQAQFKTFQPRRQEETSYTVEHITKHSQEGKLLEMRPIFH